MMCGLLLLEGLSHSALATTSYLNENVALDCQIEGDDKDNFRYLAAQCWLPPSEKVRGILCVVLHPSGINGRILADSFEWQQLAAKSDCALIAVSFVESLDPTKHWFQADDGSGGALFAAINTFSVSSKHPELASAPILAAGVCAAGQFSYELAAFAPSRMLGFITIGGAMHRLEIARKALSVPGLLIETPDRGPNAMANLQALAIYGILWPSRWRNMEGPIALYDKGYSQNYIKDFILECFNSSATCTRPLFFSPKIYFARVLDSQVLLSTKNYPLSFLGKPLPIVAQIESTQSEVVSPPGNVISRTSFRVKAANSSTFDAIKIPPCLARSTQIHKLTDIEWEIDVELDLQKIPNGSFRAEIPLRFFKNEIPLMGGLQVPLSGVVHRDIYPIPSVVIISGARDGGEIYLHLRSRSGTPISEVVLEQIKPNCLSAKIIQEALGDTKIILSPDFNASKKEEQIAGYIIVRAKSKEIQSVKIPFYGIVKM